MGDFSHSFDATILRAYDIRGVFGATLSGADAYAIGVCFARHLHASVNTPEFKVAVGRDGRLSSPELAEALIRGLVDGGAQVLDLGQVPTPMVYFADRRLDTDGAIQVTGSHNPPDHNGFKLVANHAPFFGEAITQLGQLAEKGVTFGDKGTHQHIDLADQYYAALRAYVQGDKDSDKSGDTGKAIFGASKNNIVWDCGNGVVGPTLEALLAGVANQHILCAEVDGTFPNHHPDPTDPKTLAMLQEGMKKHNASLGIGFDGDGDRIGLVDSKGRHVVGDVITAYLAQGVLPRHPGAPIIFDVKSSWAAMEAVAKAGGKPQLWKTGRSHIQSRLMAVGAPLAGEMSGHIFIAGDGGYGYDDALLAACAILRQEAESGVSISDFIDGLPSMVTLPETRHAWEDKDKFAFMDAVLATARSHLPHGASLIDIDGVRVNHPDGWWLLRASNTGAELVSRCEGRNQEAADRMHTELERIMQLAAQLSGQLAGKLSGQSAMEARK